MKRTIPLSCLLVLTLTSGSKSPERVVSSVLKEGILEQAGKWLDMEVTELCKQRFKEVFIPTQMAEDGNLPVRSPLLWLED